MIAQTAPYFLNTSTSSNATYWSYTPPANTFTNNRKYTFVVEAIDAAGNVQTNYCLGISSFTIIYDTAAPSVAISAPPTSGSAYQRANIGEGALRHPLIRDRQ